MNPAKKCMLITGAGGALGSQLALISASRGWETILLDKSLRLLDPVRMRMLEDSRSEPLLLEQDLTELTPQRCEEIVTAVDEQLGRLDSLVHCAAEFDGLRPVENVEPMAWLTPFQVNVHAAWLLSARLMPLLRRSESGSLVFLTENLEHVSGAYWGAYGASKWALEAVSAQFAAELTDSAVRVLAVDPGPFHSALRARAYHSENPACVGDPREKALRLLDVIENVVPTAPRRLNLIG